jgi:ubiquinone/menaquinone biosynthesis C-methylase UbiE
MEVDPHLLGFYSEGTFERDRLSRGRGRLEFVRTQELLRRYLPSPPARVLDVGGGPGVHAAWLADDGYEVVLIDPVPALVAQAQSATRQGSRGFDAKIGDARALDEPDGSIDAVVMLGPLYHLPEATQRAAALREAARVLKPGGTLAAAAIGRYIALLDIARRGDLDDETFRRLTEGPLRSGRNAPGLGFTTAYFHRPDEFAAEIRDAGFIAVDLLAIEGPAWILFEAGPREGTADTEDDHELLAVAVRCAQAVERVPELLGASSHLLAIARRQ